MLQFPFHLFNLVREYMYHVHVSQNDNLNSGYAVKTIGLQNKPLPAQSSSER